jgi:two-component system chemotaxis sensor kinase CheA
MDIDRGALLQLFLTDSEEDVARLEVDILALEGQASDEAVAAIFRTAHTLKGNASILSLDAFARLAHSIEDVLDAVRGHRLTFTGEVASSILTAVDALRAMLASRRDGKEEDNPAQYAHLEADLAAWVNGTHATTEELPIPAGETRPERESTQSSPTGDANWGPALRIEMARIDQLLALASRALILHGQLGASLLQSGAGSQELLELHQRNERVLLELQDWVIDARMIPVSNLFRTHARTVRDVARAQQKRARLQIEGERVRVDTGIGESARDVLTHLVRNAIDHGIESPAVRVAQGKSPEGTITLRAAQNGNQVVIQVADDGGGFNLAKIRKKARLLGRANADSMPVAELQQLIFEPGFSTAEQITDLSGRGVGMDVVRRNVEDLHGTVEVESVEGKGTTIELRLPLSLSVIEGFWVDVAGTDYVLPLHDVIECLEVPQQRGAREGQEIIDVRGEPLACLHLRDVLDPGGASRAFDQIVVVRHRAGRVGLGVDAIRGERQTVIKPLGRLFRAMAGISGSALRPDGSVAFVIDIARLLRSAPRQGGAAIADV